MPSGTAEPAEHVAPIEAAEPAKPADSVPKAAPVKAAKAAPAKKAARKAAKAPVKKTAPPAQRKPGPSAAEVETVSSPVTEVPQKADDVTTRPLVMGPSAATPAQAEADAAARTAARKRATAAKTTEAETTTKTEAETTTKTPQSEEMATRARARDLAAQAQQETPARTEAWAKIVADPGHAPELLALAATQTIGPRAREWARRTYADYPAATPDAVARLAVAQFTRAGGLSSIFAAVAGSYSPVALLGANAFTYAELVLHVAAAYGLDPTDPQRAVDLLVLTGAHPDAAAAEAALATARQPVYEEDTRLTDAVTRLGRMVAAQGAAWTVVKGVNRFFPGTTMLAAIMISRNGSRTMGAKATNFYRRALTKG